MNLEISRFEIDTKFAGKVLLEAGYKKHWKGDSYIKDLYNKKRWHAFIKDGYIEYHLDRTDIKHNKHFVEDRWLKMYSIERKLLKRIWHKYNPIYLAKIQENISNRIMKRLEDLKCN